MFKQNLKTDNRSELLIFITPRIIKDGLTLR
jgi:type II secretory pathway component HofQ